MDLIRNELIMSCGLITGCLIAYFGIIICENKIISVIFSVLGAISVFLFTFIAILYQFNRGEKASGYFLSVALAIAIWQTIKLFLSNKRRKK